ncbi:MAG: hypothetical protein HYZ91_01260 [Candidatus Omnitrophica bacterium]|nr:hypothetical protein [Candidatus Omnitrophota bacterium]
MNRIRTWVMVLALSGFGGGRVVLAHEGHEDKAAEPVEAGAPAEQTLAGEVVDVFCYLSHGEEGLGARHAGCATKCIQSGLPVALKVGDRLYLATMATHDPANKTLAKFAGQEVTVHGQVMERDGQHLIAVTRVEQRR